MKILLELNVRYDIHITQQIGSIKGAFDFNIIHIPKVDIY
jgi:hypothetical protein